jgi:hypothetical protein
VARQQLEPVYHRNGAAYAITRECLLGQRSILGKRASAVVVDEPMLSIDTEADFAAVERALAARGEPEPAPAAAPGPYTFVVDVDGVVASLVPGNDYNRSAPLEENVALVNALHEAGHRIVLFTARGSATGRDWEDVTRRQMEAWGVRYHELRLGKPSADWYIDDRLVTLVDAVRLAAAAPSSGDAAPASGDAEPASGDAAPASGDAATKGPGPDPTGKPRA